SRTLASGDTIRRRRECTECSYRFTSYERIEEKQLMVVKRSGDRREPFSREKLERGIQRALEKRPVSQVQIENMINQLEDEAVMKGRSSHEIGSQDIGEMVLKLLYRTDKVAYIRFASVYRNFEGVGEFVREIETLSPVADNETELEE
ncbi:MAG TPA: transcriptional regulator NrdR, partial [Spirochaetia bacterium]|nr:transcriptional regulator NrdR [Spirochaetia bacterium]